MKYNVHLTDWDGSRMTIKVEADSKAEATLKGRARAQEIEYDVRTAYALLEDEDGAD